MDVNERVPLISTHKPTVRLRPISVSDYHRMGEAGIFADGERVELIEGQLIAKSPIGSSHFSAVNVLNRLLMRALGDLAVVSVQNPVRLDDKSEPEPHLAVLLPRGDEYRSGLPGPADVILLIEVAASSIDYDRGVKLPLYALHGIQEFWVVDLEKRRVEVYRNPLPDQRKYASTSYLGPERDAGINGLPGVTVPFATVFG